MKRHKKDFKEFQVGILKGIFVISSKKVPKEFTKNQIKNNNFKLKF